MTDIKACLIYTQQSKHMLLQTITKLTDEGYTVCSLESVLRDAIDAQSSKNGLPMQITECIEKSDICVFLLPEQSKDDEGLGGACTFANQTAKPVIGIMAGHYTEVPQEFDDCAQSMIREKSKIGPAIIEEIWENTDGSKAEGRKIIHIKCQ